MSQAGPVPTTPCPVAAAVEEICVCQTTIDLLADDETVLPDDGVTSGFMIKMLTSLIEAAEARADTVQAHSLTGVAMQVIRLQCAAYAMTDFSKDDHETDKLMMRVSMITASILDCLATGGVSLPQPVIERYGEENSLHKQLNRLVEKTRPTAPVVEGDANIAWLAEKVGVH